MSYVGLGSLLGGLLLVVLAWQEGVEYVLTVRFFRAVWLIGLAGSLLTVIAMSALHKGQSVTSSLSPGDWFDLKDTTPGLAALAPETLRILDARAKEFKVRRDYLLPALRRLGFEIPVTPQGAFYIYAGCARLTRDSFTFSRELLEQAGVAITPGKDFGDHRAGEYVRFAYTNAIERLEEGVRRIARFLGR